MDYTVMTPCGKVQGTAGRIPGVAAYKGIRYATAGRWEYPEQVKSWEGVYDATQYGACCYQPRAFYDEEKNQKKYFYYNEFRRGETYEYSEDCLFLNIFTPDTAKEGDNLPVLFYIHGGGFTGGCGHEKHFDCPVWPKNGVIAVTVNYRLGPMGFLCLPELAEEAGVTGNYGLYDQLAAMQWVHDNIAAFGGDPENVTIMGQSAGAMSVQHHCMSPLSEGLFKRAVMSSGGGVSKMMPTIPADRQYAFWKKAMENAGCKTLAAFRALEPEKLFDVWKQTQKELHSAGFFPCVDGRLVVAPGPERVKAGKQHKIEYMAGTTSEDMMPPILFGMARKWCSVQQKPGYTWFFDRQLPGDTHGAWHSSDLWYWFGTFEKCWRPMEEKDFALSEQMVDYLCSFVKCGDPNASGKQPKWEPNSRRQKKVLVLGEAETAMRKPSLLKMIGTMLTKKAAGE